MLLAGDEIGRTQKGNNNAYCQDNEISWIDWDLDKPRQELLEFTRLLTQLRHQHPVMRRRHFFQGRKITGSEVKDLTWFRPDGKEMTDEDWNNPSTHSLALCLAGYAIEEVDERGKQIVDDTLLILMNVHHESISFVLPAHNPKIQWKTLIDTREATGKRSIQLMKGGELYSLEARSLVLLQLVEERRSSPLA